MEYFNIVFLEVYKILFLLVPYRGRVNNEPENNRKTLLDLKNA